MTFKLYFTAANEELLRAIENLKLDEILLVDDTKCEEQLSVLRRLFTLLEMLVLVTRKNDKQTILTTTLKFFNVFMTLFLGPCLKFLRNVLQRFPAGVVSIIKTVHDQHDRFRVCVLMRKQQRIQPPWLMYQGSRNNWNS